MPAEVTGFVECPMCGFYVSRYGAHTCSGRKPETFPRPPSNEQTLLTELGEVKRQLAVADKMILSSQAEVERSWQERDALAVTAEAACDKVTQLSAELKLAKMEASECWDGWKECQAGHKECLAMCIRQAEQIRRLREALTNCVNFIGYRKNVYIDAAAALLKETAPPA